MLKLIKSRNVVTDEWKTVVLAEGESPEKVRLPVGPLLVPLRVWLARRVELVHREYEHGWPLGVWLAADEGPEAIERDIEDFTVIAIEFDKFGDGRGFDSARLLRKHYGYKGALRPTGDVFAGQLFSLHDAGFDVFAVTSDDKGAATFASLHDRSAENPNSGLSRSQSQQRAAAVA